MSWFKKNFGRTHEGIPISREFLKDDLEGEPAWFMDGQGNELHLIANENTLKSFQITLLGQYCIGAPKIPIRFGFVELNLDDNPSMPKEAPIRYLDHVPADFISIAERFITNIKGLDSAIATQIISLL